MNMKTIHWATLLVLATTAACSSGSSDGAGDGTDTGTAGEDAAVTDTHVVADSPGSDAADSAKADTTSTPGDAIVPDSAPPGDATAPKDFWATDPIPAAKNVMMFRFLNRTNGKSADANVYWSFKNATIDELHSIAAESTYDMPANSSGRLYLYICAKDDAACNAAPRTSKYFDFIEHTIGTDVYNGNTTRVDAFGLKIALRLHCADGYDVAVGEDYETFAETREATFAKFQAEVPAEFKKLADAPFAPYRIVEPGALDFKTGGANAHYYDSWVDQIWSANGVTVAKPGPGGSGLDKYPDLSAAIMRHVGGVAGTFGADGKLLDKKLWDDATKFYTAGPADYYARFWHAHGLSGKAYGFPYDDVGGYSSYVSHKNPQYILVAVGW